MKAVIFDLDGTLWDSTGQVYQIWNSVFARYPGIAVRVTRESVSGLAGKTMEDIGAALFPDMGEKRQRTIMDEGDEVAARFAGIPFIHAAYGFGKAVSPDAIAHEIRELPRVVRRILP